MSGFCKIALVGEYYSQSIVNILRYRSDEWLPLQGNPFAEMLLILDAVLGQVKVSYLECMTANYTLLRAEGIGYADDYSVVTASPVLRDVGSVGTGAAPDTTGAVITGNIRLQCGEQNQINLLAQSKRNIGYVAIGPVAEDYCDNYGHITPGYRALLNDLADDITASIVMLSPACTLIPIRIHEVKALGILTGRTYSDVLGYTVPRRFGFRRSRQAEA